MHTFHRRTYGQVPGGKDNEGDPKVFEQRPELHLAILHNMHAGKERCNLAPLAFKVYYQRK